LYHKHFETTHVKCGFQAKTEGFFGKADTLYGQHEGKIVNQHKMDATGAVLEAEEAPDLQMTWHDLDLERNIYRQEDNGAALSAILLAVLAVPVAFFLFSAFSG
jgi:hypothetical protein